MLDRPVPAHIARAVRNYDHRLRLRWSRERGKYVIERRAEPHQRWYVDVPVRRTVDATGKEVDLLLADGADKKIRYKDGYYFICECPAADNRLLQELYKGDGQRIGVWRFLQKMEVAQRHEEERRDALRAEELDELGMKTWHDLHPGWVMSMAGVYNAAASSAKASAARAA